MKNFRFMTRKTFRITAATFALALASSMTQAQSGATRPRRVTPVQPTTNDTAGAANTNAAGARATAPAASASGQASTAHAFTLLQQKQYDAALKEATQVAAADEKNSEAWKI